MSPSNDTQKQEYLPYLIKNPRFSYLSENVPVFGHSTKLAFIVKLCSVQAVRQIEA